MQAVRQFLAAAVQLEDSYAQNDSSVEEDGPPIDYDIGAGKFLHYYSINSFASDVKDTNARLKQVYTSVDTKDPNLFGTSCKDFVRYLLYSLLTFSLIQISARNQIQLTLLFCRSINQLINISMDLRLDMEETLKNDSLFLIQSGRGCILTPDDAGKRYLPSLPTDTLCSHQRRLDKSEEEYCRITKGISLSEYAVGAEFYEEKRTLVNSYLQFSHSHFVP